MGVLSWVYLTEKTFLYSKLGTSVFFTKMTMPGKRHRSRKKALADFSKYDQKLNDPETIISALDDLGEMEVRMDQLGHYGFLKQSTDMTDPHYNQLLRILDQLEADYNAELAKYRAQIMDNDNETLDAVSDKRPDLGAAIREFKRIKSIA